jgi:hypothetical protein
VEDDVRTLTVSVLLAACLMTNEEAWTESPVAFPRADLRIKGAAPSSASIGDFNGDKLPDIAISNRESRDITILTAQLLSPNSRFKPLLAVPKQVALEMVGDSSKTFLRYQSIGRIRIDTQNQGQGLGDFNKDGTLDLVVANVGTAAEEGRTVSVLLGQGEALFSAPKKYVVGAQPTSVSVADVNRDGPVDLVVTNRGSDSVSVLIGDGSGGFNAGSTVRVGGGPYSNAVGDLNKDGALDVITANWLSNTVSVVMGKGDGTFESAREFTVGRAPSACALADLDGDSILDLIVANCGCSTGLPDNTVSVLKGRGDGTFAPQVTYEVGEGPSAIAVADFNRDGAADLAIANRGSYTNAGSTVSLLLGTNAGTFKNRVTIAVGSAPTGIEVTDANGDHLPDLVVVNSMSNSLTFLMNRLPFTK